MLGDAKVGGSLAELGLVKALAGEYGKLEDLLRRLLCNVLDGHATGGAEDESGAARLAIKGQTQVELFGNVDLLDKVDGVDGEAVSSALVSHEGLAEQFACDRFGLGGVIDEVDTSLEAGFLDVTETTTAAKDLGLDDAAAVDAAGNFLCLIRTESDVAHWNGH